MSTLALAAVRYLRLGRGWQWATAAVVALSLAWHTILLLLYWQILAAFVGALLLLATLQIKALADRVRTVSVIAALLVSASGACLAVLPLFSLPPPTGQFAVGTTILHLVDPARRDASFASGHRELMVQVWYPAESRQGRPAPYRRWRETTLLSSYDAVIPTHAHRDANVAKESKPFPLLLFNPAWEGQRTQDTFLVEDLASHGFVVAAIDHTHNSMPVAFPDGHVVLSSEPHAVDDFGTLKLADILAFAQAEIRTQVADDRITLDAFAGWEAMPSSQWFRRVDTTHDGALGHSFGGAVAVAACAEDQRILAALNMDGWMFGAIDQPLGKPLFVMNDGDWPFNQEDIARERRSIQMSDRLDIYDLDGIMQSLQTSGGYLLAIDQTQHMNFTDRPLYSPLRGRTGSGLRDPAEVHRLVRAFTLAFFSEQLRDTTEPMLQGGKLPAGVHFEAWKPESEKDKGTQLPPRPLLSRKLSN